jgi:hypothetical protein
MEIRKERTSSNKLTPGSVNKCLSRALLCMTFSWVYITLQHGGERGGYMKLQRNGSGSIDVGRVEFNQCLSVYWCNRKMPKKVEVRVEGGGKELKKF